MASTTSSIVTIFCILAVGHLAQAEAAIAQDGARKLLQMDAMSPMMMAMAPAASMMNAMAPVPMMMNSMFNVSLTPTAEVPGTPNSGATAMCMLTFMDTSIMYNLTVMNIVAPTAAHIHSGAVGKNGPVLAFLYNATMTPSATKHVDGQLASGTLMASNFVGPAKNMTVMQFYNMYIATGMSYVNVHTLMHPDGEIRGQINSAAMVKTA